MKNSQNGKILVIRLSSIGDIVLTTGFIRLLRKKFPNSKIDFLIFKPFSDILKFNPHIDQIITCEKNANDTTINKLKNNILQNQGEYDIIFDLHNNLISNKFTSNFGHIVHKIDKRRFYKLKLVWLKKGIGEKYKRIHEIYLDTMKKYGADDDYLGLEFWLENDKENLNYQPFIRKFEPKNKLNIVVAPGAHFKTKQWGYLNYAHLIRKLQPFSQKVTLVGGINDSVHAQKIIELNPDVINLCGKTSLIETCNEIDKADLLITNDTGVMHIAAARKVPVVTIFGSSVKELGFEPYGVRNLLIESEHSCRPCSHIGRRFCPLIHFKCMNSITPNIALNKIIEFIHSVYG